MIDPQQAILLAAAANEPIQKIEDSLIGLLNTVLYKAILPIGAGLIVIAVIIAGYRYILGDPKAGKSALVAAVIGTVIVILSYWIIVQLVVPAINGVPSTVPSGPPGHWSDPGA